ncbi:Alpha/beta hydrolase family protein [Streptomyces sp. YIM 130001]|uniref:alpha/beta hydrolase n=1 Tax=Streptomyces sp. YIM 130001 TaxID=2259644 RepID=UPI000E649054|nr:alpha/beta hydrolase [Streptomyces sp. YIM 130001]RII15098.1 Alpha/beta hydrolase family protein [Streptomyces sp. YIM 130001]
MCPFSRTGSTGPSHLRRGLTALAACGALLAAGAATATPEPAGNGVPVRAYTYGPHARQTVTVYGDGGPALVILHGGSWAKDTDWSSWARWFANRGLRVYDTDYRLNSDAPWPAQRDDTLAALRWVARHGGPEGQRPVLLGSSAGGHLATTAGTYGAGLVRLRGVVALSPVASPYKAWLDGGRRTAGKDQRDLRNQARQLAGCDPDRARVGCWERWGDMAARNHASGADDAPMYLVHSARDWVPAAHSHELARAQRAAGAPQKRGVRVRVVPGAAHGAKVLDAPEVRRDVLRAVRGFESES